MNNKCANEMEQSSASGCEKFYNLKGLPENFQFSDMKAALDQLPDFKYRPGAYHTFIKQTEKCQEAIDVAKCPYFIKHKLHLAFDQLESIEFKEIWKLLLEIFKEDCIFGVKLCDPNELAQGRIAKGKEVTVYFIAKECLDKEMTDEAFFQAHINCIQKIAEKIKSLNLPPRLNEALPIGDIEVKDIVSYPTSDRVFLSGPDQDDNQKRIQPEDRGVFINFYALHLMQSRHTELYNQLKVFAAAIETLERTSANEEVVSHLKSLCNALASEQNPLASCVIIAEHFTQLINQQCRHPDKPLTYQAIEKSSRKLENKLFGKPPINKVLKAIVCGVIGALVGAAIGVLVGVAVTSWVGGFGALPGAILGMVKGLTVGAAIGSGIGSVCGFTAGFFQGKKQEKNAMNSRELNEQTFHARFPLIHEKWHNTIEQLQLAASIPGKRR